jgi:uncharacterized protein
VKTKINIPKGEIAELCRKYHVRRHSLFGSVLSDDFGPESDVDVLVEFEPGRSPGLDFFALEAELTRILGQKLHLNTLGWLSKYIRDQALAEAEAHYVAS